MKDKTHLYNSFLSERHSYNSALYQYRYNATHVPSSTSFHGGSKLASVDGDGSKIPRKGLQPRLGFFEVFSSGRYDQHT